MKKLLFKITNILLILSLGTSNGLAAFAAGASLDLFQSGLDNEAAGVRRATHDQTGKLRFLGADPQEPLAVPRAMGPDMTPSQRALAILDVYGPEFGINNPSQELTLMSIHNPVSSRVSARYQQVYQGIPVLAGELIVNMTSRGELLSISGEISPDLDLDIQASISLEEARESAVQIIAKQYGIDADGLTASYPELWVYDARLLRPSGRRAELIWRIEVRAKEHPINELVLINAHTGGISLNFNQMDSHQAEDPMYSGFMALVIGAIWYVAPAGSDVNDCQTTITPCASINGVLAKPPASGDTIRVAAGTYTGSGTEVVLIDESVTLSGGWDATFSTQNSSSTIDGQDTRQGVNVAASITVTIDQFIITNGSSNKGAGIYNAGALTLNNTTVHNNSVPNLGGGIYNSGVLTLNNCTIGDNITLFLGGGIYSTGPVLINNSVIENNIGGDWNGDDGGGISIHSNTLTLFNSSVINNFGYDQGGGIYGDGGSVININNSTISGNTANQEGGGIVFGGTLRLNNATITNNYADKKGGGIYLDPTSGSSNVTSQNSILAGNSAKYGPDCYGSMSTTGYNIIKNLSDCTITPGAGDQTFTDPLLGPILGNPPYYPLPANSPAKDNGNPSGCTDHSGAPLTTDQRGMARSGVCDIGAYEYTIPGSPDTISIYSGTPQNTAPLNTFLDPLQILVVDANGNPAHGIVVTFTAPASGASGDFADSATNTTTATTNQYGIATSSDFTANGTQGSYVVNATVSGVAGPAVFELTNSGWYVALAPTGSDSNDCQAPGTPCATIAGALSKPGFSPGNVIVVAEGAYTSAGAEVVLLNKSVILVGGWDVTFTTRSGATVIDGEGARRGVTVNTDAEVYLVYISVIDGYAVNGGGISIAAGSTATLENCLIQGNTASTGKGGGIYNLGILNTENTTISENATGTGSSQDGGGIYTNNTLNINTTTISNNTANRGGGIFNYSDDKPMAIINSTISGNFSFAIGPSGAGIWSGNSLSLINTTLSGNAASGGKGGAIYNSGNLDLFNVTIFGNWASEGGGIYSENTPPNGVVIRNSILAANEAYDPGPDSQWYNPDCSGIFTSRGHNLLGNNNNCGFTPTTGDLFGTRYAALGSELGPLQDNGGPTFTHAPILGSPVVNAGNSAAPGSSGDACEAADQRGVARPVDGLCDMGAFEGAVDEAPSPVIFTFDANNATSLPGTILCTQLTTDCTGGADPTADAAHLYAFHTFNFFYNYHGRISYDGSGSAIVVTVHYDVDYANAFWNGEQIVFGDRYGYALADDVVGHEIAHGFTDYGSNLYYYYQSGAINESFSDLWGEFVDLTNGYGDDSPGVRWSHGEDVTGKGPNRDMADPTLFDDPDKVTSSLYYIGGGDNGGVHTNSGINNKAVYLMVDGGIFNGYTISALGIAKVAAIYYEVQTSLLTSGSDYKDLYHALYQGCLTLVGGSEGIVEADCQSVRYATIAVEMNRNPSKKYNPEAQACPSGYAPDDLFYDDFEDNVDNWSGNSDYWIWTTGFAANGVASLYGTDYYWWTDEAMEMIVDVYLPAGSQPFLHFNHAFGFEDPNYDGGWIEISDDGGTTWTDIKPLFDDGLNYGGTLAEGWENPNEGHRAFIGDSHGYVSTRYDLSSMKGKNVRIRFRISTDFYYRDLGWLIDDLRFYTCVVDPGVDPEIFSDGFEYGDFSAWSAVKTGGKDLLIHPRAALEGRYGVAAIINDRDKLILVDDSPDAETRYRAQFYFDIRSLSLAPNQGIGLLMASGVAGKPFQLFAGWDGAQYFVVARIMDDNGIWNFTAYHPLADAPTLIEIDWSAASAPGADDGFFSLTVGGVLLETLSGLDNDTYSIDKVILGPFYVFPSASGIVLFDSFASDRGPFAPP